MPVTAFLRKTASLVSMTTQRTRGTLHVYVLDELTGSVLRRIDFPDPRVEFEERFYSKKGSQGLKLRFWAECAASANQ